MDYFVQNFLRIALLSSPQAKAFLWFSATDLACLFCSIKYFCYSALYLLFCLIVALWIVRWRYLFCNLYELSHDETMKLLLCDDCLLAIKYEYRYHNTYSTPRDSVLFEQSPRCPILLFPLILSSKKVVAMFVVFAKTFRKEKILPLWAVTNRPKDAILAAALR